MGMPTICRHPILSPSWWNTFGMMWFASSGHGFKSMMVNLPKKMKPALSVVHTYAKAHSWSFQVGDH